MRCECSVSSLKNPLLIQTKTPTEHQGRGSNPQARRLSRPNQVGIGREPGLTERLTNDHEAITRAMGRLSAIVGKSEISERSSQTEFFTQFAKTLKDHFRREEQLLFPLLRRSLGSDVCDRLKNECAEIVKVANQLTTQARPLKESFRHLEHLFRAHISTEENVLFWYLDLHQPSETDAREKTR